ncbi:MAG: LysE family translocator [Reyranellaceae bacterium]
MNETLLLIQCAVIGFSIALPVGPVAVLCIRRTLVGGLLPGISTGIGATAADTIFGSVAVFGIGFISEFIDRHQLEAEIIGATILIGMGVYYVRHRPPSVGDPVAADREHRILTDLRYMLSSFAITLFNPLTLGAFAAVLAASGVGANIQDKAHAFVAIAGVAIGAASWWLLLTVVAQALRRFVSQSSLQWLNWITGGVLIAIGTLIAVSIALPPGTLPWGR